MSEGTFDVLPLVVVLALVAFGAATALIESKYSVKSRWDEYQKR